MQLSSKGRYAVMAMADLAAAGEGAVAPLAAISARQDISLPYLEQLFARLRRAGLVDSMRGPGGGYRLARDAGDITLAEVMAAVDEPVKMTRCADEASGGCVVGNRCLTHDLWRSLGNHIVTFLDGISLGDVVENAAAKEAVQSAMAGRREETAESGAKLAAE
jgi:Rrf2 family iron-sulfur cluster assembly transcriptional regulator